MGSERHPTAVRRYDEPAANGRLGRLRLGAEPLADQLARLRRAAWALTAIVGGVALSFLALFTAFDAPGMGLVVVAVLLLPIVGLAWLDYRRQVRHAARYERRGP